MTLAVGFAQKRERGKAHEAQGQIEHDRGLVLAAGGAGTGWPVAGLSAESATAAVGCQIVHGFERLSLVT